MRSTAHSRMRKTPIRADERMIHLTSTIENGHDPRCDAMIMCDGGGIVVLNTMALHDCGVEAIAKRLQNSFMVTFLTSFSSVYAKRHFVSSISPN